MSEDDVDMLAADGQGPGKVDRDRRAPRFSWTPAYEATFFRSLCESVQLGMRENSSFKAEAWERAALALQESHSAFPTKNHLINKSDNARKRFRLWRGLREDPDFVYNPKARTVTATEEAWRAHIEREPLSRALRGRPFDHEDYMETLYPDVIGSGGAPKRIMKPKRRDGQPGDDSELLGPNASMLSTDQAMTSQPSGLESPSTQSALNTSSSQPGNTTPSSAPTSTTTQGIALTPPEDTTVLTKKRSLATADLEGSLSAENTPSRLDPAQAAASFEKRIRFSAAEDEGLPLAIETLADMSTPRTTRGGGRAAAQDTDSGSVRGVQDVTCTRARGGSTGQWREKAVDLFYRDFAAEELDLQQRAHGHGLLQNAVPGAKLRRRECGSTHKWGGPRTGGMGRSLRHDLQAFPPASAHPRPRALAPTLHSLLKTSRSALITINMSYASAAAKGPKQTPAEAAAPPVPEIIPNESASTSSLIDVDMPSVHTVPSDFLEQDVQTETQASRLDREAQAAKAKAERARKETLAKAKKADSWLTQQISQLSDGTASRIALGNLATFVGISSYLGYKAWGLYEKGRLDGKAIGLGVGILAGLGAAHTVVGSYLYRGKKN
ncbi:hypothetical protein CCM_02873 [Cordyceps militaris CM01]|uniref:Myb/SANT-like domain-containing protein n=1 Tax=Cordyceps militaris (strain CM01) TaxID=983644 RepID=G3JCE1_CORMM|nr:uncharacterized protein CCM_02873 [Cordyceps militaris CM01]EGX94602.1 hypothetical protein CCM_02873 [Cordyceps militaris CM01]